MIDNDNKNDKLKETIVFDDDTRLEINPENEQELTTFSIETYQQEPITAPIDTCANIDTTEDDNGSGKKSSHKWLIATLSVTASVLFCCVAYCGWWLYNYYYNIGVPVSVSTKENIVKLQRHWNKTEKPEIVLSADSILGVALNMYELKSVQAELTFTEPDTTDASVLMYSRSADHTSDQKLIGSFVMNGKELSTDKSRLGYCAMANGNIVIGVSRSDKVKDYVVGQGGCFFRQFILLSNGVLPPQFQLHGKVERRALARMGDDRLFYIETRHAETLWDFADALREYGFADAIYITGGKCHSFYRTADGKPHDIGDVNQHPHLKYKKIVPWIVFKAR